MVGQDPIEAARGNIVCPLHGMTDCSPLLNGCSLVNWIATVREIAFEDGRAVGRRETPVIPLADQVADMINLWDSDRVLTAEQAYSLAQYLMRIREVES